MPYFSNTVLLIYISGYQKLDGDVPGAVSAERLVPCLNLQFFAVFLGNIAPALMTPYGASSDSHRRLLDADLSLRYLLNDDTSSQKFETTTSSLRNTQKDAYQNSRLSPALSICLFF